MIAELFIPKNIGSYYLIPQRILGFDIGKTQVHACQLYSSGNTVILEKKFLIPLSTEQNKSYQDRVVEAIKTITEKAGSSPLINTSLSSTFIVYKELVLPLMDEEKIRLILNYEIEASLPFPLNEAVIDFIITKASPAEQKVTILAAALQKKYLQEHIDYFKQAGLDPASVHVDMFDLYGLYNTIEHYRNLKGGVAFIDLGLHVTRMAYIVDNQLKIIRSLPKGIAHLSKQLGSTLKLSNGDALENLVRFGLKQDGQEATWQETDSSMRDFWKELSFTLQSFITQTDHSCSTIVLLESGAEIPHIQEYLEQLSSIPCIVFSMQELSKNNVISITGSEQITPDYALSLACALPIALTSSVNMRREEQVQAGTSTFIAYLATTIFLAMLFITALGLYEIFSIRSLKNTVTRMEQEVVKELNTIGLASAKNINQTVEDAEDNVTKEEELWFAFSHQTRFSFLKSLQDLSEAIDRKSIGLVLKKLILTNDSITIEAEVKGFEELKVLERELRDSKLFVSVPTLQELKFSEKLLLRKTGGAL